MSFLWHKQAERYSLTTLSIIVQFKNASYQRLERHNTYYTMTVWLNQDSYVLIKA